MSIRIMRIGFDRKYRLLFPAIKVYFIQDMIRSRERSNHIVGQKELVQLVPDLVGEKYSITGAKSLGLSHLGVESEIIEEIMEDKASKAKYTMSEVSYVYITPLNTEHYV